MRIKGSRGRYKRGVIMFLRRGPGDGTTNWADYGDFSSIWVMFEYAISVMLTAPVRLEVRSIRPGR